MTLTQLGYTRFFYKQKEKETISNEDLILKTRPGEGGFLEESSKHVDLFSAAEGTVGCLNCEEGAETSRCSVGGLRFQAAADFDVP